MKKELIGEKLITPKSGWSMLFLLSLAELATIGGFIYGVSTVESGNALHVIFIIVMSLLAFAVVPVLFAGLKVLNPNEALVLTLFGKYYGTIAQEGFFFVNPFCSAINPAAKSVFSATAKGDMAVNLINRKISLKAMTLNNEKQKVNDLEGNPIEIGVVVIWKIVDAAKAVFNVDNYSTFISTQCDSAIRQVARAYPYDISEDGDEKSLRGSSQEIAEVLKGEIQGRVEFAGIEVLEARIAHLAYAQEIAAAMLQRQQATAIIAARQKIVEGAVGMVDMALHMLNEGNICTLDDERKAQMVSNLLVVLCGNKDAQPIVNSGSIF